MFRGITKVFKILFFIIFKKDNFFRNYLLTPEYFKKISQLSKKDHYDLVDFLQNITNLDNSFLQYYSSQPFNSQIKRTEIITSILETYKPEVILETGTFLGSTTEYLSGYAKKVVTIERSELYYLVAAARLQKFSNVKLLKENSSLFIQNQKFGDELHFFYLDAHWGDYLPLQDELEQIFKMRNFIICIDDFKVPDGQDWGYDTYGKKELSIENFQFIKSKSVFFPNYNLNDETGGKRGSVFIASEGISTEVLSSQKNLSEYLID